MNIMDSLGGTSPSDFLMLLLGNIFTITTLRCHSLYASRVSYIITCICTIAAAAVSPSPQQSFFNIVMSFMVLFIYQSFEDSTQTMFSALLDVETTKRKQTIQLKQFIGNVAHDMKVSYSLPYKLLNCNILIYI